MTATTTVPATTPAAAPTAFDWANLASYKTDGRFIDGLPPDERTLFSPYDGPGIHRLIVDLLQSAQQSVVLNMYGYDDDEADAAIRAKAAQSNIYVQMSLDRSQAGGVHEAKLLKDWNADAFGTSIAVGTSAKHAISHLKMCIVDGVYTMTGSTNWSLSGEQQQDNQLTISRNAAFAAQCRAILDRNHAFMLQQMQGRAAAVEAAQKIEAGTH
ncbi:MAG TPA: phospholipase D-like domain-containing protein [Solirubrobacteraceae bacterium]